MEGREFEAIWTRCGREMENDPWKAVQVAWLELQQGRRVLAEINHVINECRATIAEAWITLRDAQSETSKISSHDPPGI